MPLDSRLRFITFLILEIVIFLLFYSIYLSWLPYSYILYVSITPVILCTLIYLQGDLKNRMKKFLLSRDIIILLAILTGWYYAYALYGIATSYLTTVLYAPVLLEELNFRYVVMEYIGKVMKAGSAVIAQAALYTIFYLSVLIATPGAYPGLYYWFFIIDLFSIGLIYGVVYLLRKNIYIDVALHFTLWAMIPFTPLWLAWLPYSMAPA